MAEGKLRAVKTPRWRILLALFKGRKWKPLWYSVGAFKIAGYGDRLIIIEDKFKSGYECRACNGTGKVQCPDCDGDGRNRVNPELWCKSCKGTPGQATCSECDGKGGLLVIPEQSQRRPTTGRIVSTGGKVKDFEVGDDVLYSNFAGHASDFPLEQGMVCVRILHESEILAQVKGHLELRAVRHQREAIGVG